MGSEDGEPVLMLAKVNDVVLLAVELEEVFELFVIGAGHELGGVLPASQQRVLKPGSEVVEADGQTVRIK